MVQEKIPDRGYGRGYGIPQFVVYHVVEVTFRAMVYHSRFLLLKPLPYGIPYMVYHGLWYTTACGIPWGPVYPARAPPPAMSGGPKHVRM